MRRMLIIILLILCTSTVYANAELRTVTVQAEGYIEAVPDTLQLTLSVRAVAASLQQAQAEVDTITRQVLSVARSLGVLDPDMDSARMSGWPEYEWRNNQRIYLGEAVERDVVLRVRDLDSYGSLIGELSTLSLHRIHQPQLSHSNIDELHLQALRVALAQGKLKASAIAAGVGAELGEVVQVDELGDSGSMPMQRMMMAEAADTGSTAPSFSFAAQRISAQLQIRYSLR